MGKWIEHCPPVGKQEMKRFCGKYFLQLEAQEILLREQLESSFSPENRVLFEKYLRLLDSLSEMRADVAYIWVALIHENELRLHCDKRSVLPWQDASFMP